MREPSLERATSGLVAAAAAAAVVDVMVRMKFWILDGMVIVVGDVWRMSG